MGGQEVLENLGSFMMGVSQGLLKKHVEDQEVDRDIEKALKKYERVQQVLESGKYNEEQKRTLYSLMGIKTKEEDPLATISKMLINQNRELQGKKLEQDIAGTGPDDVRADKSLGLQGERLTLAQKAAKRKELQDQFNIKIADLDKKKATLDKYNQSYDFTNPGMSKLDELGKQKGFKDWGSYYLTATQEIEKARTTLSAQQAQALKTPDVSGGSVATDPGDEDDLFNQAEGAFLP